MPQNRVLRLPQTPAYPQSGPLGSATRGNCKFFSPFPGPLQYIRQTNFYKMYYSPAEIKGNFLIWISERGQHVSVMESVCQNGVIMARDKMKHPICTFIANAQIRSLGFWTFGFLTWDWDFWYNTCVSDPDFLEEAPGFPMEYRHFWCSTSTSSVNLLSEIYIYKYICWLNTWVSGAALAFLTLRLGFWHGPGVSDGGISAYKAGAAAF